MSMLSKVVQLAAVLSGVLSVGAAMSAEAPTPGPEMVGNSVVMRSWPAAGKWGTSLARTTYDGPVCATFAVDQNNSFGLRAKDDPNGSLSLVIGGPEAGILSTHSIKVWIDGFSLGEFPVTRRIQAPTGNAINAAVPRAQAAALLDLFGTGQWIAYSTGLKTYSAPLEGSDTALKAFIACTHEVKAANELGATADPDQAERWNWIAMCERTLSAAARSTGKPNVAASCPVVWDKRATLPQFAEFDSSLKAVDAAMAEVAGTSGLSVLDRLGPLLTLAWTIEASLPAVERLGAPPTSPRETMNGPADPTPFSIETDADVGQGWRNAMNDWVTVHSHYPPQAVEAGQQGTSQVLVTTMPDGHVLSVELERGSGSPWLDLATEGLFRGAKLPPMPNSVGDQPVLFHFTMPYTIVR